MNRDDLIKALGAAYDKTPKDEGPIVQSATAGDKDVLRVIASERETLPNLHWEYPDAFFVNNLVDSLAKCGQKDMEMLSRDITVKFNDTVKRNDKNEINHFIDVCRSCYTKVQGQPSNSPTAALIYMMIKDEINKL